MTEETEPQEVPGEETGTEEGPSEETTQVAPTPETVDSSQRLQELEQQNRDLQHRLTQKGRELADSRRITETASAEEAIPADAFFSDPVSVTTKVVSKALEEYEHRQEEKRQTERYLETWAKAKDIPVHTLYELNDKLRAAQSNPEEYLEILASIAKSDNTATEIRKATKTAVDTAARNARAVTAEGGSPQTGPAERPDDELSVEELRAKLVKKYGEESS